MNAQLQKRAKLMVANGKGLLAADESTTTIGKRFAPLGIENTEENRRNWRDLLFTTPGVQQYISGVILYEETLSQSTPDGCPFVDLLEGLGILAGIKVDLGLEPFAPNSVETCTAGLHNLPERLHSYAEKGATFAKWRALIHIGEGIPSKACIEKNAEQLALYATHCHTAGLVPVVEPEVLMDGNHSLQQCKEVTADTLKATFYALQQQGVDLSAIILKPSMVVAGSGNLQPATPEVVAKETLDVLQATVPADVAGIMFLSGGQTEQQATKHLDLMNRLQRQHKQTIWPLSYSYGRALQESALQAWQGKKDNKGLAQNVFFHRCRCNSAAALGEYTQRLENKNPLA